MRTDTEALRGVRPPETRDRAMEIPGGWHVTADARLQAMKPTAASTAQLQSASYVLPVEDKAFLLRDEMRAMRLVLEYSKADLLLRDWGIRSTLIVFGSSRIPSPETAQNANQNASQNASQNTSTAGDPVEPESAARLSRQLAWYNAAREFGRIASLRGGAFAPHHRWRDNVIATGGGGGIMEAANRGASEAGAPSIGFNIALPTVQQPNPYTTPELTFRFQYFAMRKMHLAMRANALAIFPGGFGTIDELFELLTLRQTQKSPPIPIVLFDRAYWRRIINFEALVSEGMVAACNLDLLAYADSPDELWQTMLQQGLRTPTADSETGSAAPVRGEL